MTDPAILVEDLVVRHGPVVAVDGASLEGRAGEVTVVLGANGAGKTTTVETLEGFHRPARGRVRVLGLDPIDQGRTLRPRMGAMLQGGGVQPGIRVGEAVRLEAAFHQRPRPPHEVLEAVGLAELAHRPFRRLSGGEQQRLLLALALVPRPEVAFLDEPTSGVDLDGRRRIRHIVGSLADDGVAVLLTTHELAEAERMADRVVVIDRGRVLATGTVDELCGGGADIRFAARTGLPVDQLTGRVGAAVREVSPGAYQVAGEPTPARVAVVTAWLAERGEPLGDLQAGRRSLEEVVTLLVGRRIDVESTPDAPEPDSGAPGGAGDLGSDERHGEGR